MIEPADVDSLKAAVEGMHGGTAQWRKRCRCARRLRAPQLGVVHVFDMENHAHAKRAYAWSSPIEGGDTRRIFAVLHVPPITSPVDAVRAAIVAKRRQR